MPCFPPSFLPVPSQAFLRLPSAGGSLSTAPRSSPSHSSSASSTSANQFPLQNRWRRCAEGKGERGEGRGRSVGCNLLKTWLRCQECAIHMFAASQPCSHMLCRETTTSWTTRRSCAAWASPTLRALASMRECNLMLVILTGSCWRCTSLPRPHLLHILTAAPSQGSRCAGWRCCAFLSADGSVAPVALFLQVHHHRLILTLGCEQQRWSSNPARWYLHSPHCDAGSAVLDPCLHAHERQRTGEGKGRAGSGADVQPGTLCR